MPGWQGSDRRVRLPKDWHKRRAQALKRDGHRCTHVEDGLRCEAKATDVDHVIPSGPDELGNLTSLCRPHHAVKSSREGGQARAARRGSMWRPAEQHPGLI